ncbi:hypothetical protein ACGFI9_36485, partial [Micromonospora sp. NPDC048930]
MSGRSVGGTGAAPAVGAGGPETGTLSAVRVSASGSIEAGTDASAAPAGDAVPLAGSAGVSAPGRSGDQAGGADTGTAGGADLGGAETGAAGGALTGTPAPGPTWSAGGSVAGWCGRLGAVSAAGAGPDSGPLDRNQAVAPSAVPSPVAAVPRSAARSGCAVPPSALDGAELVVTASSGADGAGREAVAGGASTGVAGAGCRRVSADVGATPARSGSPVRAPGYAGGAGNGPAAWLDTGPAGGANRGAAGGAETGPWAVPVGAGAPETGTSAGRTGAADAAEAGGAGGVGAGRAGGTETGRVVPSGASPTRAAGSPRSTGQDRSG